MFCFFKTFLEPSPKGRAFAGTWAPAQRLLGLQFSATGRPSHAQAVCRLETLGKGDQVRGFPRTHARGGRLGATKRGLLYIAGGYAVLNPNH